MSVLVSASQQAFLEQPPTCFCLWLLLLYVFECFLKFLFSLQSKAAFGAAPWHPPHPEMGKKVLAVSGIRAAAAAGPATPAGGSPIRERRRHMRSVRLRLPGGGDAAV